jgi:SAM-dependent methyltransferase
VTHDVDGFRAGRPQLLPFEVQELGPLEGRLLHLGCGRGLDTLDIARLHPTVEVTGVDPSPANIALAAELATELKLEDRARFTGTLPQQQTFGVVYTGKGAVSRLPDLDEWAEMVRGFLAPDGFLYVSEYHPVMEVMAHNEPVPILDYFTSGPCVEDTRYRWIQPLAPVLTALIRAGMHLQLFHEWDYSDEPTRPWLVRGAGGYWRWPGPGSLPLMYSVKAWPPGH